ncbi:epoxide hydrolase 4-like [Mizuhopecten yessoensis]|uniref:Epoxide hydrolase 4 n=1 Tax=Mizuhopecten yessoensis TaxID=6573 RepID=A0A210QE03_MIZYE|nr:epoxide hydrolase 4-like [Mizuhopecten yessoensis]OWF46898.1 Epoxide hydrolase 4 [Mizuhopecten yessoensis]
MTAADYLQLVLSHVIAGIIGILCVLSLLWRCVRHPFKFLNEETNRKKRDIMPACLNDPTLGTHGFIHLEHVKLHYVSNGDEKKPLMLLIHGFPEFWYSWRFQLRAFAGDYRVVALDLRGYSESEKPNGYNSYTIENLVGDIKQLIPALGHRSAVVVGHDWGGAIAWGFAMKYQDMVDKLIIMNCPHPATFRPFLRGNFKQLKKSWYMFFFQVPYLPEHMMSRNDYRAIKEMFTSKHAGLRVGTMTDEDVEAYKYAFSHPGGLTGPLNFYRSAMKNSSMLVTNVPKIQKPTLIIWGCQDLALCEELPSLAKDHVTNLTIRFVQDASHWVQMDTPDIVNEHMQDFLNGIN